MPYIGRDMMKQWENRYKYLLQMREKHGSLKFDQQRQWEFLAPIFEGGDSEQGTCDSDDGASRIG